MLTIRFSHDYPKLHGQTSARLLAVLPLTIDAHTPAELLEYDTTYYVKPFNSDTSIYAEKEHYPLKHGKYLQLVFIGNLRIPFCTIRAAYPPSKVQYYLSSVGQDFSIQVEGRQ